GAGPGAVAGADRRAGGRAGRGEPGGPGRPRRQPDGPPVPRAARVLGLVSGRRADAGPAALAGRLLRAAPALPPLGGPEPAAAACGALAGGAARPLAELGAAAAVRGGDGVGPVRGVPAAGPAPLPDAGGGGFGDPSRRLGAALRAAVPRHHPQR